MSIDSRQYALKLLDRFDQSGLTLDRIIDESADGLGQLPKRDRDFITALVFGTLRWRAQIDFVIQTISSQPLRKISPTILNILRIGAFQILHMNRIPESAAVNTAVEMTKTAAPIWVTKFVNGVLRNMVRKHHQTVFPSISKEPVIALATRKSFPEWLIQRWVDRFGVEETEALCDATNAIPSITLRTNRLLISRKRLVEHLKAHVESISPTTVAPDGVVISHPRKAVNRLPGFEQGWFQVQDEAAQLVSLMLEPKPGEVILDACAGVGGKTGHIAQLMNNNGTIFAVDNHSPRLAALRAQMNRLTVGIVKEAHYDLLGPVPPSLKLPLAFDRILLDAPCSGIGVIRRNPDTKWRLSPKDLTDYGNNQLRLLEKLSNLVKPAGHLVYAVCSTEVEETDDVLKRFINRHPEFTIFHSSRRPATLVPSRILENGMLKTYPHRHQMDGFFAVSLRRSR